MEENKVSEQKLPQGENGGRKRRKKHHRPNGENNAQGGQVREQPISQTQKNEKPQNQPKVQQNIKSQPNNGKQKSQQAPQAQGNSGNKKKNSAAQQQSQKAQQQPRQQKGQQNKGGNKDENRKDTYLYTLDGNLYVNLTNKCSNACDFCVRNERTSYYGNYLWLRHGEPTVEKVISAAHGMGDLSRFQEAVFCGFGEPTYRLSEMIALCDFFHEKGLKTRLNTNGQGNLINKRDIVSDLKGKIDLVNVSLNASCYEKYQPVCRSQFRESGFEGMLEFAKTCKRQGVPCRFSIVDCIGEEEVEACKRLADSLRIPLYVRKYITDS